MFLNISAKDPILIFFISLIRIQNTKEMKINGKREEGKGERKKYAVEGEKRKKALTSDSF